VNYLFFHVVPGPGTIYTGIKKVLPAHYIICRNGDIETNKYWTCEFNEDTTRNQNELKNELHNLLRNAVENCLFDDNTGAFLSGGIDSSTVTGILSEFKKDNTNTFTIGFDADGYDETSFARTTANHFKTNYYEYRVSKQDVFDIIPKISEFYDNPFGNSSAVPVYYCADLAKSNGMTNILAGDGGDELFAGNYRYVREQIFQLYNFIPKILRRKLIEPITNNFPENSNIALFRKINNYINHANIPMPDRLESYNYLVRTSIFDILHQAENVNADAPDPDAGTCRRRSVF